MYSAITIQKDLKIIIKIYEIKGDFFNYWVEKKYIDKSIHFGIVSWRAVGGDVGGPQGQLGDHAVAGKMT